MCAAPVHRPRRARAPRCAPCRAGRGAEVRGAGHPRELGAADLAASPGRHGPVGSAARMRWRRVEGRRGFRRGFSGCERKERQVARAFSSFFLGLGGRFGAEVVGKVFFLGGAEGLKMG